MLQSKLIFVPLHKHVDTWHRKKRVLTNLFRKVHPFYL